MRKLVLALGAMSVAIPAATVFPAVKAEAKTYEYKDGDQRRSRRYAYREWRGRDGRMYCRKSDGTTGLVIGGVAGALVGRTIDTRGDRTAGTVLGAVVGGLAGRELERRDQPRRCR